MKESLLNKSICAIDEMSDYFISLSDEIWDNPELSLKEFKATELYIKALDKLGFKVDEKLGGIDTAFSGSFGSGKPVIGILGEYDALANLSTVVDGNPGHGCGHNLLGIGSLCAAFAVKKYLEYSNIPGTIIFYGCPGEEGGSGKAFLAREGLWKKLDAALTWHPSDVDEVKTGTNNSSIQVLYKFSGISSHAASCPEIGRSALDAVELMNIGVQFLREHTTDDSRIHYSILDTGGSSPNVVQSKASVLYMTRANKEKDCIALQKRVDDIAKGAALMTETSFERIFVDGTSELLPNFTLEKLLCSKFKNYGLDKDHYSDNNFRPGSTDVGDVSFLTPTAQIDVACWPAGTVPHTLEAVSCGKSPLAHSGMLKAAKILAEASIELMESEDLLHQAKQEFSEKSKGGYFCPIEKGAVPFAVNT